MFKIISLFRPLLSVIGNASRYDVALEDCVHFLLEDLEKPESEFVGNRAGLINAGAGKAKCGNGLC